MDIMSAIAAGTKALEALKAIQDINKQYDAATWKGKVAELMSDIADMKLALIDANENTRQLEKEKEELVAKIAPFPNSSLGPYGKRVVKSVRFRHPILPSPFSCRLGPRIHSLSRPLARSLSLRPGDS
jgi:hypothetical protein